jgi:hypothetical protein
MPAFNFLPTELIQIIRAFASTVDTFTKRNEIISTKNVKNKIKKFRIDEQDRFYIIFHQKCQEVSVFNICGEFLHSFGPISTCCIDFKIHENEVFVLDENNIMSVYSLSGNSVRQFFISNIDETDTILDFDISCFHEIFVITAKDSVFIYNLQGHLHRRHIIERRLTSYECSIATNRFGELYISDYSNDQIIMFNQKGKEICRKSLQYPICIGIQPSTTRVFAFFEREDFTSEVQILSRSCVSQHFIKGKNMHYVSSTSCLGFTSNGSLALATKNMIFLLN